MDDVKKRPFYKSWWFWVLLAVFLIIVVAAASGGDKTSDQAGVSAPAGSPSQVQASASAPASVPPASPAAVKADMQLGSGYYTSGIDFPPGKYDITAVSGSGNVSSNNMFSGGINALMGTEEADKAVGGGLFQQQYSNISLPEGVVLSVSGGVTVRITSDNASAAPLKQRVQPNTQTVELGNGNFVSGEDFPAGTYDIAALSGGGNVSSDNMFSGGINSIMGVAEANDVIGGGLYEQTYKNVQLPEGVTLTVDGVKIQLVPSK